MFTFNFQSQLLECIPIMPQQNVKAIKNELLFTIKYESYMKNYISAQNAYVQNRYLLLLMIKFLALFIILQMVTKNLPNISHSR